MNKIITDVVLIESEATAVDLTVEPTPIVVEAVAEQTIVVEIGDGGGPRGPEGQLGPQGPIGPQGLPGSGFVLLGHVPTYVDLPLLSLDPMDAWVTDDTNHLWVWNGSQWVDCGDLSGPQGYTGPVGPQGAQGVEGPLGPPGETGQIGALGPQGPQGIEGPQGPVGPQGIQGFVGQTGPQGATGAQGPKGDTGNTGSTGAQGPAGIGMNLKGTVANFAALPTTHAVNDAWITADTGHCWVWTGTAWTDVGPIQGPKGDTGAAGAPGATGATGAQGIQGVKGDTGATGATGAQGATGTQGPIGVTGATGAKGDKGDIGNTGVAGPTGSQGPVGPTGPTGPTGPQGLQGSQGLQGIQGIQGPPGPVGEAPADSKAYARRNSTWYDLTTDFAAKAPLANPVLTGTPQAPTPAAGTNTTQLATTAFVQAANSVGPVVPLGAAPADGTTNLNALTTPGWAPNLIGPNNLNIPAPGTYWYVQTMMYVANYYTQYAYPYYANIDFGTMRRSCNNGVWSPWQGEVSPGVVEMLARSTAPQGWLKANGALVSRTTYAALFAAIGTLYGVGDGSTTFALPDLRGEFIRGFDDAKGTDAGRVMGSAQAQGTLSHTHTFTGSAMTTHDHGLTVGVNSVAHAHSFADSSSATGTGSANHVHNMPSRVPNIATGTGFGLGAGVTYTDNKDTDSSGAAHTHTVAVSGTTGNNNANHTHTIDITAVTAGTPAGTIAAQVGGLTETRPRNIALLACIKY